MIGPPLVVRHECPQCGAGVELGESDRLLVCPYCRVRLCLYSAGPRWLYLPARFGAPEDIIHVPYWRFRGARYVLGTSSVTGTLVDHSLRAASYDKLPASLGVRPQVIPSRFVRADIGLRAAPLTIDAAEYLRRLQDALWAADRITVSLHTELMERDPSASPARTFGRSVDLDSSLIEGERSPFVPFDLEEQAQSTQVFIGETVTVLCAPFLRDGNVMRDGLTGDVAGTVTGEVPAPVAPPASPLRFHASLCPECGHDLEGDVQALVLTCVGCGGAWQAGEAGLVSAPYELIEPAEGESSWVPFWRISVAPGDLPLQTLGDLLRFANQSVRLPPEQLDQPLAFWIPATKANPDAFLRWARIATLRQRPTVRGRLPGHTAQELHPVTLPVTEAIESVPVVLAAMCVAKRQRLPAIKRTPITARSYRLVMVPFRRDSFELVQRTLGFSMQSATLGWGKDL